MMGLEQLYHKLEIGGYLLLYDWLLKGAREALIDFRKIARITEDIYQDYSGCSGKKPNQLIRLTHRFKAWDKRNDFKPNNNFSK